MLKFILAFAAAFGLDRRSGQQGAGPPISAWPHRRHRPDADDKVLIAARRALDGVDHPLIL
jgi:hypothetical protein